MGVIFLAFTLLLGVQKSVSLSCYEPGTLSDIDLDYLDYCPCKFGFYGPTCFEIHQCVIGDLVRISCRHLIDTPFMDRCAYSGSNYITVCNCPDGFRGDVCEYMTNNDFSTVLKSMRASKKLFDTSYIEENQSPSGFKIIIILSLFITIFYLVYYKPRQFRFRSNNFRGEQVPVVVVRSKYEVIDENKLPEKNMQFNFEVEEKDQIVVEKINYKTPVLYV